MGANCGEEIASVRDIVPAACQSNIFESAFIAKNNARIEKMRVNAKIFAQPFQVRLILQNGVKEFYLMRLTITSRQGLCPILLGFGSKNPSAVVFGFKDINAGFM